MSLDAHAELINIAREIRQTEPDRAVKLCNEVLNEDPDTPLAQSALYLCASIMMEAERLGMAYHLYQRCAQLNPSKAMIWSNMAACIEDTDPEKALKLTNKAHSMDRDLLWPLVNSGLLHLKAANPKKCISLCNLALEKHPDSTVAKHNISLAKLCLREWPEAWDAYDETLGVEGRTEVDYGIPNWDGKSEGKLLIYGEQGVGDEIMFASMIHELMETHEIIISTDTRLKKLFRRTFDCPVYGDRFKNETTLMDDHKPDYQVIMGQLGGLFRRTEDSFPGTPYLKANPDYEIMYRALFDTYPGLKIGVAWTGGTKRNGAAKRSLEMDDLIPLFNKIDNTFISLEYMPVRTSLLEQFNVKHFEITGKGREIDELAALISQLDMVVTCCTTVVYIAGALGIPCHVLVPSEPSYRYHLEGGFPWYNSVQLHRQKKGQQWSDVVKTLAEGIDYGTTKSDDRIRPGRDNSITRLHSIDTQTLDSASELHTP